MKSEAMQLIVGPNKKQKQISVFRISNFPLALAFSTKLKALTNSTDSEANWMGMTSTMAPLLALMART